MARVRDVGTLPSGAPYLVMEYLDGRDFDAVLAEHGALDPKVAVKYILQACEALAEAHAMGIVHRDLKPANLILTRKRDGTTAIKIIDFGISKLVASEAPGPAITQASMMMGSPLYMAPEQMTSARDVDARGDVFSLGAMLYHLLTNKPPFVGNTAVDVFERISLGPPSPRAVRPDLPAGIEAVTSRCLRKTRTTATPTWPSSPRRSRPSGRRTPSSSPRAPSASSAPRRTPTRRRARSRLQAWRRRRRWERACLRRRIRSSISPIQSCRRP